MAKESVIPDFEALKAYYAPIGMLRVDPGFNIRAKVEVTPELYSSVADLGITQPVQVRTKGDNPNVLWIVDGECRFQAAKMAKLTEVPVINNGPLTDVEATALAISSDSRVPFTDDELRLGVVRLHTGGCSVEDIMGITGYSERKIREFLRIEAAATPEVKAAKLPSRVAARAAALPKEKQKEVVEKIKGKDREAAMEVVRKEEKKLGKKARGPAAKDYPVAKGTRGLLMSLEYFIAEEIEKSRNNPIRRAQLNVISVLKGEMSLEEFKVK
jgi:ParB-like chromosome segregation protein Spo0J